MDKKIAITNYYKQITVHNGTYTEEIYKGWIIRNISHIGSKKKKVKSKTNVKHNETVG